MKPDMRLDYALFQLTPTRTRCELHVAAQGLSDKLASGLLKPFATHLRAVEEQLARGGYSIRLEPPDPVSALWFTKNTMEKFVRFVSTPEVLERVSSVEAELIELEETVNLQVRDGNLANEPTQGDAHQPSKTATPSLFTGGKSAASANREKPVVALTKVQQELPDAVEGNSKQRLLRALDARQVMLQKEQGMAFARAIAAGFSIEQMGDLVAFATCFGATRLREACMKFMSLCKKRQESGLWLDDMHLAAIEARSTHQDLAAMSLAIENKHGQAMELDVCHSSFPNYGKLVLGEDGAEKLSRQVSLNDEHGQVANSTESKMMGDINRQSSSELHAWNTSAPVAGRDRQTPEELQGAGASYLISAGSSMDLLEEPRGNGEYREPETNQVSGLPRGHLVMASWQGNPHKDQYVQSFHAHSPYQTSHTPLHNHLGLPYGYSVGLGRGIQPGLPYPQYLVSPYMQPVYADISPWQTAEAWPNLMGTLQPPLSSQYQGNMNGPQPNSEEFAEGHPHIAQHCEANSAHILSINEVHHVRQSAPRSTEAIVDPQSQEHGKHDKKIESPHVIAAELPAVTRRSPRRSSSPSMRSSSPMRKVRIGRSGPRRSGMVVIQNINHIAPNSQDQASKDDKDALSSGSCREDGDSHASDQEGLQSENETVRVNVQDVIGRFETQNGSNDARRKPSKKETQKISSEKSGDPSGKSNDEEQEDITFTTKHDAEAVKGMNTTNYGGTEGASFSHDRVAHESLAHDVAVLVSKAENHPQTASLSRQPGEEDMLAETEFTTNNAQSSMVEGQCVDDMLIVARERCSERFSHLYSGEVFAEQHGLAYQENPIADDSFMVLDRTGFGVLVSAGKGTVDQDFECANNPTGDAEQQPCDNKSLDDSFMVLNCFVAQEGPNISWKTSFNLESEMPLYQHLDTLVDKIAQTSDNFEPDDLFMVPARNKKSVSEPWNSAVDYDMQLLSSNMKGEAEHGRGEHNDEGGTGVPSENGIRGDEKGGKSKELSSKRNEREVKPKAMQAMAERMKSAMDTRSDRATSVAEAQVRAEKMTYKSSIQKGSKDKEEQEDMKRLEDLKKQQRRDRISGHGGEFASSTPRRVRPPTTPPLSGTKTSAAARESVQDVAKAKVLSGSRFPRTSPTPLASPKPAQNLLSRSVPSLTELRKDSRKPTPAVRASTGSQRLSQIKSSEKALDSASKDKKRPASTITLRKGIPPTKETKGKGSESSKTRPSAASKPQKTAPHAKLSLQKEARPLVSEVATQQASIHDNKVVTDSSSLLKQKDKLEGHKQEATIDVTNAVGPDAEEAVDNDIKASESIEVPTIAEKSAAVDESVKIHEESKEDTSTVDPDLCSFSALSEKDEPLIGEGYHAPVAHVSSSSFDDNSETFLELNLNDKDVSPSDSTTTSIPLVSHTDQYNPPSARPAYTLASRNLPRLQEAILQVHSPEASPVSTETSRRRPKWGDSAFHVKGFKRLLFLGRKSSRSSAQNSSDWGSGGMASEGDEDGDVLRDLPSINGRRFGIASTLDPPSFSEQARKNLLYEIGSEGSSKKASRPFFSFPSFHNRSGERKSRQ